jgi:hypothetical protein
MYRHHFYVVFGEVEWHCINDDEYNKWCNPSKLDEKWQNKLKKSVSRNN